MNKYGKFYTGLDLKHRFIECDDSDKSIHIVLHKLAVCYKLQLPVFMIIRCLKQLNWLDNRRKRHNENK
jgi:hypothetical protein